MFVELLNEYRNNSGRDNSAENGEPKRGVVSAAWRDKLTQQPDDDACDDHSDYFHGICLSVGQPRLRSQL